MKIYHFTKEGFEKLQQEKEKLLSERPFVISELKRARELGDLSENGLYKSSKMRLGQIDSRVFRLSNMIKGTKIIEPQKNGTINLGSTVTISDGKKEFTYTIVGSEEANPKEGKISNISPLGSALVGKRPKQEIRLKNTLYKIVAYS